MTQMIKNLPAMQETWVQSLGQEDMLEKGIFTMHPSVLDWRISCTEKSGRLQSMGSQELDTVGQLHSHTPLYWFQKGCKAALPDAQSIW